MRGPSARPAHNHAPPATAASTTTSRSSFRIALDLMLTFES